ncbi:MAG: hypothetical protein AB7E47_13260 [Desulfovibrionaceae bacterium]
MDYYSKPNIDRSLLAKSAKFKSGKDGSDRAVFTKFYNPLYSGGVSGRKPLLVKK